MKQNQVIVVVLPLSLLDQQRKALSPSVVGWPVLPFGCSPKEGLLCLLPWSSSPPPPQTQAEYPSEQRPLYRCYRPVVHLIKPDVFITRQAGIVTAYQKQDTPSTWPWDRKLAMRAPFTAFPTSLSWKMSRGDFPPSSRVTGFTPLEAISMICRSKSHRGIFSDYWIRLKKTGLNIFNTTKSWQLEFPNMKDVLWSSGVLC